MPAVVPVDLEELVAQRVHARLQAMNGTLIELVARAVDAELDQLVADELQRRRVIDGGVRSRRTERKSTGSSTIVCSGCNVEKPVSEFETGRRRCRACRRPQRHPKQSKGDDGSEAHPAATARRWKWSDEDELREERRKLIADAPVEKHVDEHGREWTVRRLPATFAPG